MAKTKRTKKKLKPKKPGTKILTPEQSLWREPNGNFKRGNPGGPGRPFKRQERFLVAINDGVSECDWETIIKRAVNDAKDGDRHAREWLSKWLIGEPKQLPGEDRTTVIDVLTDGGFVKWIESGGQDGA